MFLFSTIDIKLSEEEIINVSDKFFIIFSSIIVVTSVLVFNLIELYLIFAIIALSIASISLSVTVLFSSYLKYIFTITFIFYCISILLARFTIVNFNGSSPVLYFFETALCITAVFRFGTYKGLLVSVIFIVTSLLKYYLYNTTNLNHWLIINGGFSSTFVLISILSTYIVIYSIYFSQSVNKLRHVQITNHRRLLEAKNESLAREKKLSDLIYEIENISAVNSHKLRGPLSRLKGLIILLKISEVDTTWSENAMIEFTKLEIARTIDEISNELFLILKKIDSY